MTADDVAATGADEVVVATGSRPPGTGFQRALPMVDRLPGVDAGDVSSIQDVLDGTVVPGRRVLVLDDLGDWRGLGTALHLVERGHEVTILTAAPVVAGGLFHSAADGPLRKRYARAGGRTITSACVLEWRDGIATVRSTMTGRDHDARRRRARHRRDARRRSRARRGAARPGRRLPPGR